MEKLKVVDLFAGAGGLSCGLLQTSCFEIIAVVENNEHALETYKKNHNIDDDKLYGDIRKLQFDKLKEQWGEIDVVVGGPPCQGFSNANRQKKELISGNNQLVKEYVRAVEELKPRAFIMENVETMMSKAHKFFCSKKDKEELEELGITLVREEVVIGKKYDFTYELLHLIENSSKEQLEKYILDTDTYSRLNAILKIWQNNDLNALSQYMQRKNSINFLKKLTKDCDRHHKYWSLEYEQLWRTVIKQLSDCFNNGVSDSIDFSSLEDVVETQKILAKSREIKEYEIEAEYPVDLFIKEVVISVQTYNVFEYLRAKFKKLGYKVESDILNAADYGVPQLRRRLFIVGVHEEYLHTNGIQFPPANIFTSDSDYYTIRDAIGDLKEIQPEISIDAEPKMAQERCKDQRVELWEYFRSKNNMIYNHVNTDSTDTAIKRFEQLKPGENFHNLDDSLKDTYSDHTRTQNTIYKRLDYEQPSGTVLNARKSMWIHPEKDRAISIREAARLQSFPDDYVFVGVKDAQYQQIGNAVPPLLARAVGESLLDALGYGREIPRRLKDILKKKSEVEEDSAAAV